MPGRVEPEKVDHYKEAEALLGSGVPDDKLAGVGHAILALVDELSAEPGVRQIAPKDPDEDSRVRSWQS